MTRSSRSSAAPCSEPTPEADWFVAAECAERSGVAEESRARGFGPGGRRAHFLDDEEQDLDLASGEIRTVVWATGHRPDHSWVNLPISDRHGQITHDGGVVTGVRGLYLLGMPFLRRRRSTFIHGARDTDDLAELIHRDLARRDCEQTTTR